MSPLDPVELSAYFDGELPPERTREIDTLLNADANARATLEQLKRTDQYLKSIVSSAPFEPSIQWQRPDASPALRAVQTKATNTTMILTLILVLIAWIVGKTNAALDLSLGPHLDAAALLLVLSSIRLITTRELRHF